MIGKNKDLDKKIMKKTYKITLPKGAKVYTIDAKADDGVLNVTVNMEQKYVPKDGDVVSCKKTIVIYAGTNETGGIMTHAALHEQRLQTEVCEIGWGYTCNYRPATEAEKQRLFDALAKHGKRWNAEKKCIEDLPRWRAEVGYDYYLVERDLTIRTQKDLHWDIDNSIHNVGNYFRTREAAEKVAEHIREIFKHSKAE